MRRLAILATDTTAMERLAAVCFVCTASGERTMPTGSLDDTFRGIEGTAQNAATWATNQNAATDPMT